MAAGLLDKKESEDSGTVIGPSMPEPEPPHVEVPFKALVCFLMNSLLQLAGFPELYAMKQGLIKSCYLIAVL